ncbi:MULTISPECIES: DUF3093 domain-containing protein [Aeromicrobium]|uniref:DUF3093 domain-containing protein n=1 Tax=Aeromicrobium phoceense TaxID=2754045 RepID=A0A838XP77_9ACTN|nr:MULTISPECIES: DUF3093 domain-containing protein [Aeromicrobium]MBA4608804.1 DUF3093 domain-containing protein [Aeromicrobium phoceense]
MKTNNAHHRERLVASGLWWGAVGLVAATIGWLLLVATSPAVAGGLALLILVVAGAGLWRYGSLLVVAEPGRLRAGDAHLEAPDLGEVVALDPAAWRAALSRAGTDRAFLLTRPWIDRGVRVEVADPADPTPYWLVSTRRPDALTRAVGHTGPAPDERIIDGPEARDEGDA